MLETLLGGVFGGLLRLAPEVMRLWDRKDERKHELQLLDRELEFAKTRAESALREGAQQLQHKEFEAIESALQGQAKMSVAAGWFVAAINALVRPITTYAFLAAYFVVKLALYSLAISQGGQWQEVVLSIWTKDDTTILFMIISFWFVGRVYERKSD
jgi:hypothetical protein